MVCQIPNCFCISLINRVLALELFSSEKYFVFCRGVCVALYGRCHAVCNLESWELCIPCTGMVHLQTGRSTELFINCKFLFSPLWKAFLPQVWETKFQKNSFGNLTLLKIQNYFATFLKHCIRVDPLAVLNLLAVFLWERFLSSSPPLPFWLEAVKFSSCL